MKNDNGNIIWGIIGCGDVAEIKSGPAFQKCNHSELLAVMRRDGHKAKDFAERHQVPLWYDNATQLLQNEDINAVYIATPPSTHLAYALQSLEAGKDVYLEKPMVLNEREAKRLNEAVNQCDNKLVVAHYRRYLPMYLKIKNLLDTQAIGDVMYVDITYLKLHSSDGDNNWRIDPLISGGGLFHDLAPHQLDLMYYFFGDYTYVKGYASNQAKKYEASDTVNGIIGFRNGIQFRGIWSFDVSGVLEIDNCTIYGGKGAISFPFYGNEIKLSVGADISSYLFENPNHIQQPFIQETVNYFLNKRTNPCAVEEGAIVTTMMDRLTHKINN